ncbi:MAG: hypothetical protein RR575_10110 [Acinetobacter sp.]
MAARDHKDLLSRSQDLSLSFIQHFIEHEDPWYIKDSSGRYILASHSYCKLYGCDFSQMHGMIDHDISRKSNILLLDSFSHYEHIVFTKDATITTLECNYFNSPHLLSIKVFILKKFIFNDDELIIVHIRNVEDVNLSNVVLSRLGVGFRHDRPIDMTLSRPLEFYASINPAEVATEKQWEVAWLVLTGMSYRDISVVSKQSTTSVVNKLNSFFERIKVNGYENFIAIGDYYGWINFIPCKFNEAPSSTLLKILYK